MLGQFDTSAMAARAVDLAIVRLRWPERPKRDELNFPLDTYHYDYLSEGAAEAIWMTLGVAREREQPNSVRSWTGCYGRHK